MVAADPHRRMPACACVSFVRLSGEPRRSNQQHAMAIRSLVAAVYSLPMVQLVPQAIALRLGEPESDAQRSEPPQDAPHDAPHEAPEVLQKVHSNVLRRRLGPPEPEASSREAFSEQQNKFDELIDRNIALVLEKPQPTLNEAVFDLLDYSDRDLRHKLEDLSQIAGYASGVMPWRRRLLPPQQAVSPPPSSSSHADTLLDALDAVDGLLDTWDRHTKVEVLRRLQEELDEFEDAQDFVPPASPSPLDDAYADQQQLADLARLQDSGVTLDRIQALVILLVRLGFGGLKLAIPICVKIYQKFTENRLYMFNKRNFNRLLRSLIRLLGAIEAKVNGDAVRPYQYGHEEASHEALDDLYEEMTTNATEFFNKQMSEAAGEARGTSWQGVALSYMVSRCLPAAVRPAQLSAGWRKRRRGSSETRSDPRYSQYYAKGVVHDGNDSSDSSVEQLNILRAAEKFAEEL